MNKTTDARSELERIDRAADAIRQSIGNTPDVVIVLGSGLGSIADQLENPVVVPYDQLPGFPRTTVAGHRGEWLFGRLGQRQVALQSGRFHDYEGLDMNDIALPMRTMCRLGVKTAVLTNAAGGINRDLSPGSLMLIRDHIGLWAPSVLRGPNLDDLGPRFPDQSSVYDPSLAEIALLCARELDIQLHEGIYAYCRGPQFETPAEIRALERLGADAVGMSTVPEVLAASHGGMKALAISLITNHAAGISKQPLSHQEVLETGKKSAQNTVRLISGILDRL